MPEHRIRLRGAWDCHHVNEDETQSNSWRVNLPVVWPADCNVPLQLVRQFGRPPVDPDREVVSLELKSVPGLRVIKLNGRPLIVPQVAQTSYDILLPLPLLPRNVLWLELDFLEPETLWGEIAILIRAKP